MELPGGVKNQPRSNNKNKYDDRCSGHAVKDQTVFSNYKIVKCFRKSAALRIGHIVSPVLYFYAPMCSSYNPQLRVWHRQLN